MKPKITIIDVDGTVAKIDHRLYLIKKTPKDWAAFYGESYKDEPLVENMAMIKEHLSSTESIPFFVTGRSDVARERTHSWLKEHFDEVPPERLFMRKEGDTREDFVVKKEIHDNHLTEYEIIRVYEDRPQVIRMWQDLGYEVIDVGPGYEF